MRPESFTPILNARPFNPEPRHAETVEITLADMLSTEEQAARDTANVDAVREWLRVAYLNT